jgi:hypothetical protein
VADHAIIGAASVPPATLAPYHRNPRRGDVAAIADAVDSLGQYKPVVVNKGTLTGRPNEILAGNHTHQAITSLGKETIDVVYVDVDDDTAAKIVLADNRTGDLATYDTDALYSLLSDLQTLEGTGFSQGDYASILDDLAPTPTAPVQPGRSQEGVNTFDRRSEYEAAETRGLLLDYSLDDYDAVTERLDALRKQHGAKDNAELVIMLLEAATGTTAPEEAVE